LATQPDTARRLGLAAYVLVRNSFSSIETMIAKTVQVYDQALTVP
jgi:hypothetical protein